MFSEPPIPSLTSGAHGFCDSHSNSVLDYDDPYNHIADNGTSTFCPPVLAFHACSSRPSGKVVLGEHDHFPDKILDADETHDVLSGEKSGSCLLGFISMIPGDEMKCLFSVRTGTEPELNWKNWFCQFSPGSGSVLDTSLQFWFQFWPRG
ncbi:hypothetical protein F5887DRAFT_919615 [Amanita rubescens]|nr:hypothetical protein F5887DRAFT_919615 [Amanita rubescens]